MEDQAIKALAMCWQREFGADVEWHLAEKIRQLKSWADHEGASRLQRVLELVRAKSPQPVVTPKLA